MTEQNTRLGIGLFCLTMLVFAVQDGLSRHLAGTYNVIMVVAIRYWVFAAFVIAMAARDRRGFRTVIGSEHLGLQIFRGVLLAAEICVTVLAFVLLGLVATHAVFASYPLMIAALSGLVLGEKVGWRRWTAIAIGFLGILIILRPGLAVFQPAAVIAIVAAGMFALYGLLTRYVSRRDASKTSLFWTGVAGAFVMTPLGLWYWEPMTGSDWAMMAVLSASGVFGHWLLIRAYEIAEASALQPFAYLQLVFVSVIGVTIFAETIEAPVIAGATIIVAAGLFTLWRERKLARKKASASSRP